MPRHFQVFVASPGDLGEERQAVFGVLQRIQYQPLLKGLVTVEVVAWDGPFFSGVPLLATVDPQTAITMGMPRPSECDVVLVVLWSRMGTPLPDHYQRSDGSLGVTGTEWEYLDAAAANAKTGTPEVLVYRKTTPPLFPVTVDQSTLDRARADFESVEQFFAGLKQSDRGFNTFEEPAEFAATVADHLMATIRRLLDCPQSLKDRVLLALEDPARGIAIDDLVSFVSDPLHEPHLRVMAVDRIIDSVNSQNGDPSALTELAADLQAEPNEPVGKAGVKLAEELIGKQLAGIELLVHGAANRRWEVKAAAIAATRKSNDPHVTKVYLAASTGLSYHVPINVMIARLNDLRTGLDPQGYQEALLTIENLLRNPEISEKVRAALSSALTQYKQINLYENTEVSGSPEAAIPEVAARSIERNMSSGTSNISPADVRAAIRDGSTDAIVELALRRDAAPVKQRQLAVVLVEEGYLDAALSIAVAIRNRSEARTIGVYALRRIVERGGGAAEWQLIRGLWPRLTIFQHRSLIEVIDELRLTPPNDIRTLMEEARDDFSKL